MTHRDLKIPRTTPAQHRKAMTRLLVRHTAPHHRRGSNMRQPNWYQRHAQHEFVRANPVLYACANAGMTAEETLVELARHYEVRQKQIERLLMYQPPPPTPLTVDQVRALMREATHKGDNDE
ncbi:MAG: hypothetical protein V3W41_21835 [Planctomycetota bacterium]